MNILNLIFGSKSERDLKRMLPLLHAINSKESWALGLSAEEFPRQTQRFRDRIAQGETLDQLIPEAFALAREAARRTLGERPYDVQLLGGLVLHQGSIVEMKTGEGKTLSSVAAAYLNSLTGQGVHMVTVNDYLAERDAKWMKPVYDYLGISVGFVLSSMDPETRQPQYAADITYATNNELGFDYLRDNMRWEMGKKVQRGHAYAIIDEIDSILIDESRTPLIISGPVEDDTAKRFQDVDPLVNFLQECTKDEKTGTYPEEPELLKGDYKLEEKSKRVMFTDAGMNKIEELLQQRKLIQGSLFSGDNFEFIHYFTQALRAHKLFLKDVDYVVQEAKVEIVDEFTGRILHGRRYSEGLHQAIEAKEKIRIADHNKTVATITFQNYFRLYKKLSGMTGTADTEAKEFSKIYNLEVVVIPTNRPVSRIDQDDIIYFNEDFKFQAICDEIVEAHKKGQPVLVGTVSIEKSEKLSNYLTRKGVRHEILNAKNHAREALIIAEAGAVGAVTIATNMAGRGTDIKLGGSPEFRTRRKLGTEVEPEVWLAALAEETAIWRKEYEKVKELGGLLVIGTERHESRRIDNQLRGRSGRQGDPGRSLFFVSLDDTLMRLFANDNVRSMMGRMGMASGEPLFHPWLTKSLANAQKKVEDRNFEIRKHLLDYDDVLSKQRAFIYEQRDAILTEPDLTKRVYNAGVEIVDDRLESWNKADVIAEYLPEILQTFKEDFFWEPEMTLDELGQKSPKALREILLNYLQKDLETKARDVGTEALNYFIRAEYLRKIDTLWQEHLDSMEALRDAVYLRTYAQKNPLLEYKVEGFEMFDVLIAEIKTSIAKKIFKIRIQKAPQEQPRRERIAVQATHIPIGGFSAVAQKGERREAQGEHVTVTRTQPKVGRNDPCPCGSGKKYKQCHGR
ncbi:MAG: preprotein translocase subunit SecA [Spirochaetales bacterium]|nr:preprotein translocase subunit SecA [Spirochaetales bacterium]